MYPSDKKMWLDGIFEEEENIEEIFISSQTFRGSISGYVFKTCKNGIGYYKDQVNKIKIEIEHLSYVEIVCKDYVYCENVYCNKRHQYRRLFKTRMYYRNFAKNIENENKEALDRTIKRLRNEGLNVVVN